ncbi:type II secretion system secretin GspD [Rhodoferax sp.]|uniref:type II secretion system secretin GspD n=1 Tax=Rhodoferax sp. TaxID=50421 RepID=UPI0025D6D9D3|nr:type II secretion system secretin GspD [Rhodoferax sp.]
MQQSSSQHFSRAIVSIAACALCTCGTAIFSINAQAQAPAAAAAPKRGEPVTLNFANAEIESVARTMAVITGRNVVVDPRVKGTMTLSTDHAVSPAVAYSQFLSALRLQGFTVVESAGLDKIVPEADAKLQPGPVTLGENNAAVGSQIVTQIFKLNYENAANLVPVLRPLISPNNTINLNPGNNSLVITDYADNLRRIGRIISAMDVSNATDVEIIPLKYAIAGDLVPLLTKLVESGSSSGAAAAPGQTDSSFKTTMLAEPRSNAVILRAANPARVSLVKSLIAKLDQPTMSGSNGDAGNIYVVYLKNADATKLATTLRAAMSGEARSSSGSSGSSSTSSSGSGLSPTTSNMSSSSSATSTASTAALSGTTSNQPSTGGQIQADPSTNSLIITAPEPQYRQLRAVIDKLDGRRAQVLVESLIVEVNSDKAAEFGIQWQGVLGKVGLGTNFGTGSSNLATLATSIATGSTSTVLSNGLNLGVATKIGGTYVLGALARLMDQTGTGNVLSTPNLLTLDNEEAKIVVGQNVPFVTGTYTSTSSTTTANPFQTIERKDVGLTLRVRPQINENGTVKMSIYQEISNVDASTKNNSNGPTTNKRSFESNVLVDDGSIVVLGGLLQDTYAGNVEKVPLLGDLPYVGNFFRSESRSRTKTNLMVFLRPIVVRDADTSDTLASDRYDMMRVQQQGMKPAQHPMLSAVPSANELPELPTTTERKANVPRPLTTLPTASAP